MPRILGVDIPKDKHVEIALTYIYGIGRASSVRILTEAGVDLDKKAKDLTDEETTRIVSIISNKYKVEGDLRREITQNIKRLIGIGCYRGLRHRKNLPVRGQRTHTNARSKKGPRRAVGIKKKK